MKQGKEKDKLYISRSHTKARIAYLEIKKRKKETGIKKRQDWEEKKIKILFLSHTHIADFPMQKMLTLILFKF